ncbi:hypothetical protein D3C74_413150 [compost metagenome]
MLTRNNIIPTMLQRITPSDWYTILQLNDSGSLVQYIGAIFVFCISLIVLPLTYLLLWLHRYDKHVSIKRLKKELAV